MIALLAAGVLSPFFLDVTPEVRSMYQSLGKIVEDQYVAQIRKAHNG